MKYLRAVQLFLGLLWRPYETWRISWSCAWEVASVVHLRDDGHTAAVRKAMEA